MDGPPELNAISEKVIGCAMRVHSALGPGLLESAYEACLVHELVKAGMKISRQVPLPIRYDGLKLDAGYRLDLLVENKIVLELKTVEQLEPIHTAQLLSYLKLGGTSSACSSISMRSGIKRIVNTL